MLSFAILIDRPKSVPQLLYIFILKKVKGRGLTDLFCNNLL